VPRYAETILLVVDVNHREKFIQTLEKRKLSLIESQVRRVRKVLATAEKMDQAG